MDRLEKTTLHWIHGYQSRLQSLFNKFKVWSITSALCLVALHSLKSRLLAYLYTYKRYETSMINYRPTESISCLTQSERNHVLKNYLCRHKSRPRLTVEYVFQSVDILSNQNYCANENSLSGNLEGGAPGHSEVSSLTIYHFVLATPFGKPFALRVNVRTRDSRNYCTVNRVREVDRDVQCPRLRVSRYP